ncbi:MAG: FGGY-family carbohydrate kinase [Candidatus Hydrogenedentes bacterium]|nr:FGGY-family carbohydrate kinase [Candidatus Hydrogenedentota bacterium]
MARGILIGIDLGTTVLKVCAFDGATGAVRARASERLPVSMLRDGGREQSIPKLDAALQKAMRTVCSSLGTGLSRVHGVGVAAQGGSSIIADRVSGRARTPMISWNDARGNAYSARVLNHFPREYWRRLALRDFAPAGLCRLIWLKERRPELFNAGHIHIGAGEYLFHRLTGVWRQDPGHAIQIGAYDAANFRLEQEPLEMVGMPLSFLAPLRATHETAPLSRRGARLFGIPEGIPVAGPYIDQEAGYLSAASALPNPLQVSLGTAWVGNFELPKGVNGKSPIQLVLPAPSGNRRLVVLPLLTGSASWDWALSRFVDQGHSAALERAAKVFRDSLLPPEGLFAVPWFTQQNGLFPECSGDGLFCGVSAQTSANDMLRAVAAGMVFEFARTFAFIRTTPIVDGIVLGGGASKGDYFCRLFSAIFSPLPVYRQQDEDLAAARGALHVFGGKVSAAPLRKLAQPNAGIRDRMTRSFEQYKIVFDRSFGFDERSEPFRIARRKS